MNLILLKFLICFSAFEISLHGMEAETNESNRLVNEPNNYVRLTNRPADAIISYEADVNRVTRIMDPGQVIAEHQRIAANSNLSLNYNPATMTKPLPEYINALDEKYKYIPSDLLVTAIIEITEVETKEKGKQQSPSDVVNTLSESPGWYDPKVENAELYNVTMGLSFLNNLGPKGEPELRYKGMDGKGVNLSEYFNVLSQVRYTTDISLKGKGEAVYTANPLLNGCLVYEHVSDKVLSICIIEFLNTRFEKTQGIFNSTFTSTPIATSPADLIKDINNFVLPAAQDSGVLIGELTLLQKIYLTMNAIETINAKYSQYQEGLDLSSFQQQPAPVAKNVATAPVASVQHVSVEPVGINATVIPDSKLQDVANNASNVQPVIEQPVIKISPVNLTKDPLAKPLELPVVSDYEEIVGSDARLMQNMGINPTQFDKQVLLGIFSTPSITAQDILSNQAVYKNKMIDNYKKQNIQDGQVDTFQAFIALSKDLEILNGKIEEMQKSTQECSALQAIAKVAKLAQDQLNAECIQSAVVKLVATNLPIESAIRLCHNNRASIEKNITGLSSDDQYIQQLINNQYTKIYANVSDLLGKVKEKIEDPGGDLNAMQNELNTAKGNDIIILTEAIKQFEMNVAVENEATATARSLFAVPSSDPVVACLNTLLKMDSLKKNRSILDKLTTLLTTYETSATVAPEASVADIIKKLSDLSVDNLTQIGVYSPLKLYTDVVTQLQPKITAVQRYADFLVKNKASFTTNIATMKAQIEALQKDPSSDALQKAVDEFNKNIQPKINNIETKEELIALYNKIIEELNIRYQKTDTYTASKNWVDGWNNLWKGDISGSMENIWSSVSLGSQAVEASLENLVKQTVGPLWSKIPEPVQAFILTSLVGVTARYIVAIQSNNNLTTDQKKKMQQEAVQAVMHDVGSVIAATGIGADVDILKSGDTQAIGMSVLLNQMTGKLTPGAQVGYQTTAMNSGAYTTNINNFQAKYASILGQQSMPQTSSNYASSSMASVRSPYASSSYLSTPSYSSPSIYSSYAQPSYSSTYTKSPYAPSSYGSSSLSSSSLGSSSIPSLAEIMAMPG